MPGFDYSKWDKLELSDDEETYHPNIDNDFMIRINREQRARREAEEAKLRKKLVKAGDEKGLEELEKKKKLHVNNICTTSEDRTIVSSVPDVVIPKKEIDDFDDTEYHSFVEKNEKLILRFVHEDWEAARESMRIDGKILSHEHTHAYLLLSCLNAEMDGKRDLMKALARKAEILSQLNELSRSMNKPVLSAAVVGRYFDKMIESEPARQTFQEGVDNFIDKVQQRAVVKKQEMAAAAAEDVEPEVDEREVVPLVEAMREMTLEERRGPGGLDPVEVFETLPPQFQECFTTQNVDLLHQVAATMPKAEFMHHFNRCKASGLWTEAPDDEEQDASQIQAPTDDVGGDVD